MQLSSCYICGASILNIDGPVSDHAYIPQSPGCWKLYTEVLAKEYGEWQYPDIHRLTVDCYAAQHPTQQPDVKSAQSVTVHLVAIYLALKKGLEPKIITKKMGQLVTKNKHAFEWLNPPSNLGMITISDVAKAKNLDEHISLVNQWANEIWNSWRKHHDYLEDLGQ